jgi:hypothetical protein
MLADENFDFCSFFDSGASGLSEPSMQFVLWRVWRMYNITFSLSQLPKLSRFSV